MTVNITKVKQVFACNGSLYEFDFSFPIDDSDDLKVQVRDVNGIVTDLEAITQYEISTDAIDYSNGGTITTVSYVSGTRQVYAWPDGSILTAYRETPLIQGSSYKNNRALDQDVLEDDFDKACMQIQELDERLSRAIVVPVDEETESFQLPTKSSRINKYLAFDSDGAPMVSGGIASVPVSSFMEPVVQTTTAAAARTLLDAKGIHDNVKTVLDTYTALTTDETLLCSKAAGFTVTLFTAVGNAGKRLNIINIGTGTITIDGSGDETIGGNSTISLTTQYDAITIQSDGTIWNIISQNFIVVRTKIRPLVITAAEIADATITAAKIADATITDSKVATANKDGEAGTYSMRTLGTGAQQAMPGNATPTPADASITQAKLKTSIGSVSMAETHQDNDLFTKTENLTLPGGEYGFYPQFKQTVSVGGSIPAVLSSQFLSSYSIGETYLTKISLMHPSIQGTGGGTYTVLTSYAQQRYVTSSGEVHWVFILRDKATKNIVSMYQAPDHPCFGNGGKPLLVPHPFGSYDSDKHEIIVINPSDEDVFNMQDACIMPEDKPDRDILEVIMEDYEIDEDLQTEWPKKEITVGLPKNIDWKRMPKGSKVVPLKKRIPQPEYITTRKLWKRK